MEASGIKFACANPAKSEKTIEILNNIVSEEEAKLEFERHRANPPPSFLVWLNLWTGWSYILASWCKHTPSPSTFLSIKIFKNRVISGSETTVPLFKWQSTNHQPPPSEFKSQVYWEPAMESFHLDLSSWKHFLGYCHGILKWLFCTLLQINVNNNIRFLVMYCKFMGKWYPWHLNKHLTSTNNDSKACRLCPRNFSH